MRVRIVAGALALAALASALLMRGAGPGAAARPPQRAAPRPLVPTAVPTTTAMPWPARDPFRYVDEREKIPPAPGPTLVAPPPLAPASSAPTPRPLRLIGLVRKGGLLKAALSLRGETVVLGKGEEAAGYRVLAIDEETGVRLRGPDGVEVTLPPSS